MADAYEFRNHDADLHAACPEGPSIYSSNQHDQFWQVPVHSASLDPICLHPFMAIHEAYLLQTQCQGSPNDFQISCPCAAQCSALHTTRHATSKTVNFSPHIELRILYEDEIRNPTTIWMHEGALHQWERKLWQRRPVAPISYHNSDQRTQGAYESFQAEFGEGNRHRAHNPLDIRHQPIFIQDLEVAMHQYGDLNVNTQERSMEVLSWYLHGHRLRECRRPRRVHLPEDFLQWTRLLKNAWIDEVNQRQEVQFYVLLPDPPVSQENDEHAAQVVSVQQPHDHDSAAIFTNIYHSTERIAIQRLVRFCPYRLHRADVVALAEVPIQVQHRPIQAYYGWRPILDEPEAPLPIPNGGSIVVHIRALQETHQPASFNEDAAINTVEDEDMTTSQIGSARQRSRSPHRQPEEQTDDTTSFRARQPHLRPDGRAPDAAVSSDDDLRSQPSTTGTSYDSDAPSQFYHLYCRNAPMTAARISTISWEAMQSSMRHALQLPRHEVQAIHMVAYLPPDLVAAATQVALIQRPLDLSPGDSRRLILLDIIFHGHHVHDFHVRRYVELLRKDTTRRIILEDLGLQAYCATVQQRCLVHVNDKLIALHDHCLLELRHGDYIRIDLPPHQRLREVPTLATACCLRDGHQIADIPRIYATARTPFEWAPLPPEEPDENSFLPKTTRCLTAEQVAHTQRPSEDRRILHLSDYIPPCETVKVDLSTVQWMSYELACIPLNLWEVWPEDLQLPEVTQQHLQSLGSPRNVLPTDVHFYVDGSCVKGSVGAGIACFIDDEDGTYFAGCMAKAVEEALHAFQGEHAAMVWALLWAIQISSFCINMHGTAMINFHFNFDAMNTGYQTAGFWRTKEHGAWRTLLRALAQILEQRHSQDHIFWQHVKAHSQNPRNELVDSLAKFAAQCPWRVEGSLAWRHWLEDVQKLNSLQWIWYLERLHTQPADAPLFDGAFLVHNLRSIAPTLSAPYDAECQNENNERWQSCEVFLTLATANVLTLKNDKEPGKTTITKQQLLQQQFAAAKCQVVGLQETRHKRIVNSNNPWYHMVGHPADSKGHDGVQMWFSKNIPIYEEGPLITLKHLSIVASTSTLLIVKLNMPSLRALFITGRAPHAGRQEAESTTYWRNISTKIRPYSKDHHVFFLGDTNGHLGEFSTTAVGAHGGIRENIPGREFHNWMLEHQLYAPSTFQETHRGEEHATHCCPAGDHFTRIDYIAVPTTFTKDMVETWVEHEIDLCGERPDHYVVIGKLRYHHEFRMKPVTKRNKFRVNRHALTVQLQTPWARRQLAQMLTNAPWTTDPHAAAERLEHQTRQAIAKIVPHTVQWRRKQHVPDKAWQLVEQKKQLFRQLRALRKTQRFNMMQMLFQVWRQPQTHVATTISAWRTWQKLHNHAVATTMQQYRLTTRQVTAAIRQADLDYYLQLATDAGHAYTHEGLTAIWKKIKMVLPKNRSKQVHARHDIDAGLQRHFAALEAGTCFSDVEAKQRCIDRHNRDLDEQLMPAFVELQELPTLAEIEELCLKQRPHRAAGLDMIPPEICRLAAATIAPFLHNLIMKAFLQGTEPYVYKGGLLCPIWKQRQPRDVPEGYRGILLANVYGKILHAWARKRLLPTLEIRRAPGQLGGLPSQQTVTAIQLLRLHGKVCRSKKLTSAAVFIDLKAAFHHMLREFIFIVREPATQATLLRIFDPNEFDLLQLAHDLDAAAQEKPADIPAGLRVFLHDLHKETWFKLHADDVHTTATERGTRPGSPLADIGFNLLMTKVMHQLAAKLADIPEYVQGCQALGTTIPPLAWVDDLTIPLAVTHPSLLLPLVKDTTALLHMTFRAHGLTMNFDNGKSEAVIMYRGNGAAAYRTQLFDRETPPCVVVDTDSHIVTLRVVATYRHLGSRYTMDADIEHEVNSRIAMARQSYEELKRPIFQNRNIPIEGRFQLYNSLIISRLMYGCAVWSELPRAHLHRLEAFLIDHQRRIANIGFWNGAEMTDRDFRLHHELPPFQVVWTGHRLAYLQHVAKHGSVFHRQLLLMEFDLGKGWLREVVEDLNWLTDLVTLPFSFDAQNPNWETIWTALKTCTRWKSMIKRASRKYVLQERVARDVSHYHKLIADEILQFGCNLWFDDDPADPANLPQHRCRTCEKNFKTIQALAAHEYQKHGLLSIERPYIQSTTCPGCLRDFHTTWRVQQHLRYRSNGCWDRIYGVRNIDTPITIHLPDHLRHVKRLPAVRRQHGPLRPTSRQRERIALRARIAHLRSEGADMYAWWHPESDPELTDRACALFTDRLLEWCAKGMVDAIDFQNMLFQAIFALDIDEMQGGRLFVHWIETGFHDATPEDLDPDLIFCLEEAHMAMLEDIPIWTMRLQMKRLLDLWMNLPSDEDNNPEVTTSMRSSLPCTGQRIHSISSRYALLGDEEQQRTKWRILDQLPRSMTSRKGPYYVVHLYSGRRRSGDFHAMMEQLLAAIPNANIRILSLDTAVDPRLNIHDMKLWTFLLTVATEGRLIGLLQGPPCETWSSARFHKQLDEHDNEVRGPRPLRSAQQPWGLALLTLAELAQIFTGNCLLLKGLYLAVIVALRGGAVFLEHPAIPHNEEYPSIWRLGLVRLLLRQPHALMRRITVEQWRFGSVGIKPTTLMYANAPLPAALQQCQLDSVQRPEGLLIGKNSSGQYKTAAAKEYPEALNRSFAIALTALVTKCAATSEHYSSDIEPYGSELVAMAVNTEYNSIQPDYQPH